MSAIGQPAPPAATKPTGATAAAPTSAAKPAASAPSISDEVKQILSTFIGNVVAGVVKIEKSDLQVAASSLKQTSTVTNAVGQLVILQTKAVLNEPQDEAVAVNQFGIALGALANLLPG